MRYRKFMAAAVVTLIASAASADVITLESLLNEMVDRDALARLSEPGYECKQAGSYQRLSVAPEKGGLVRQPGLEPFYSQGRE